MPKRPVSPAGALPLIADILSDRTDIVMCKVSSGVLKVADDVLGQLGLRIGHYSVLKMLIAAGPQSQQLLSEGLRIDRSTMVGLVDDLERDGLVERHRNPEDRRAYAVEVTSKGKALLKRAEALVPEIDERAFAPLSPAERNTLNKLLLRLARSGHLPRPESA